MEILGNEAVKISTVKDLRLFLDNYEDDIKVKNCYQMPEGGGLINECFVVEKEEHEAPWLEPNIILDKPSIMFVINDPDYSCG